MNNLDIFLEGGFQFVYLSLDGFLHCIRTIDPLWNSEYVESFDRKFESFESKDTKVDGRSKPRTRKQIDAYKRNFGAGKVIELKINELDRRVQHLQQLLLKMNGTYR